MAFMAGLLAGYGMVPLTRKVPSLPKDLGIAFLAMGWGTLLLLTYKGP